MFSKSEIKKMIRIRQHEIQFFFAWLKSRSVLIKNRRERVQNKLQGFCISKKAPFLVSRTIRKLYSSQPVSSTYKNIGYIKYVHLNVCFHFSSIIFVLFDEWNRQYIQRVCWTFSYGLYIPSVHFINKIKWNPFEHWTSYLFVVVVVLYSSS